MMIQEIRKGKKIATVKNETVKLLKKSIIVLAQVATPDEKKEIKKTILEYLNEHL